MSLMRNPGSKILFDHWRDIKGERQAPARHEIDALALKPILPFIFILEALERDLVVARLAGTGLCAWYEQEFRGQNFLSLWQGDCRRTVRALIENMLTTPFAGFVDCEVAVGDRDSLDVEILLLPLTDKFGQLNCLIGSALPVSDFDRVSWKTPLRQTVRRVRTVDAEELDSAQKAIQSHHNVIELRPSADQAG